MESFSHASLANSLHLPGTKISCSSTLGWTSLLAQTYEFPAEVALFDTPAFPDQLLVVVIQGEFEIWVRSGGSWKTAFYGPGSAGVTPAGKTDRLRWRTITSEPLIALHVYLPQSLFAAAADEYRRGGVPFRMESLNALSFHDPVISATGFALSGAVRAGASRLYAESAAQFLAVHLVSVSRTWSEPTSRARRPGVISDRRLRRVLEFMEHRYMHNLTLDELSREAGISRFHFVHVFRQKMGATPHQYLTQIRLRSAAALLETSSLKVHEVAGRSGYPTFANFSAAFRTRFGCTPSEYRLRHRNRMPE